MCQWNSNKAYENQNQTQILSAPNATTAEYYNTVVYHIQYMHIYVNISIYRASTTATSTGRYGFRFQTSSVRSISLTKLLITAKTKHSGKNY